MITPVVAISPRAGSAEMTGGAIAAAGWVMAVMGSGAGAGAGSARANSAALGSVRGGATTVATGCGAAMRGGGADAAAMGGVSGFGAAVSAGAGSSMDAERFGAGMNLADIGAGLAASNAGLAAGFASAGGSSSGITSDAGCAAAADAVRDGASAMGSPVGVAVAAISVRSIGADASDWRMTGETFPNIPGATVPIRYTGAAASLVAGEHAAMMNPPDASSVATPIARCRRNVPFRISPSRLAPRRAWRRFYYNGSVGGVAGAQSPGAPRFARFGTGPLTLRPGESPPQSTGNQARLTPQ